MADYDLHLIANEWCFTETRDSVLIKVYIDSTCGEKMQSGVSAGTLTQRVVCW